jgi:hypothetical protein
MARQSQIRSRRTLVAIVGSVAMLLAASSGAWAGSAHHGHSRHGHHGKHASAASHHHAFHKGHRGHGRHNGHCDYDHRFSRQHRHDDRYYCRPCGHYFSARGALYNHVSGYHGVPFVHLSYAISNYAFGLIFYG